jgi:hypothetical protein
LNRGIIEQLKFGCTLNRAWPNFSHSKMIKMQRMTTSMLQWNQIL